ncbi:MAG TPA: YhbY family RNA-binding protein [Methanospirillum sp.]|nr:YhbY family RNA-binding protein [Methanospirillum sp.]
MSQEPLRKQRRLKPGKAAKVSTPGGYHDLKPTIWVGKGGLGGTIIEEIRSQIKTRKKIKVKWLASTDIDPAAIAMESGTVLLQVRGRTMVLGEKGSS